MDVLLSCIDPKVGAVVSMGGGADSWGVGASFNTCGFGAAAEVFVS